MRREGRHALTALCLAAPVEIARPARPSADGAFAPGLVSSQPSQLGGRFAGFLCHMGGKYPALSWLSFCASARGYGAPGMRRSPFA